MLRSIFLLSVSVIGLMASAGHAQNYVRPDTFTGPNVLIDFGTLDQNGAGGGSPHATVTEQNLLPPEAPITLRPPDPKPKMAQVAPAAMPAAPLNAPTPAMPAPVAPARAAMMAPPPAATNFNARDMLANARTPQPAPATAAQPAAAKPNDSRDRVNLASMTSEPTAPAKPSATAAKMPATKLAATRDAIGDVAMVTPPPAKTMDDGAASDGDMPATMAITLNFPGKQGTLDNAAKESLDNIIKTLKTDNTMRAQIRAFAAGTPETSGQARRLSLTRALATRSYLMDHDIAATRLDIRALGNGQGALGEAPPKPGMGSMDRVDVTLVR